MITKDLLIEALSIAKDNYDYDNEDDKAQAIEKYIEGLLNERSM
jgi:hypothetical protein